VAPVALGSLETTNSTPWSQLAREPEAATRLEPPPSVVPLSQSTGPACDDAKVWTSPALGTTGLPEKLESLGQLMNHGAFDAAVHGVMEDQHRQHSLRNPTRMSRISEPWGAANEEGPPIVRDDSAVPSEPWMPLGAHCSAVSVAVSAGDRQEESRRVVARELARVLIRSCYTCVAMGRLSLVAKQESRTIAKVVLLSVYRSALLLLSAPTPEPEPHTTVGSKLPILRRNSRYSVEGLGNAASTESTPSEKKKCTVKFLLEETQDERATPSCEQEDNVKANHAESRILRWQRRATGAVSQLTVTPAMLNGSGRFYLQSDKDTQAEDAIRDLTHNVLRLCYALAAEKEPSSECQTMHSHMCLKTRIQ